ncbi:hypothetical protein TNCV_656041 [Trichonephila clavipes]|nr:hypothetical protein TNCV_656041 [Trichonephila clavipes]
MIRMMILLKLSRERAKASIVAEALDPLPVEPCLMTSLVIACIKSREPAMQTIVAKPASLQHCFESNVPRRRLSMQGTSDSPIELC